MSFRPIPIADSDRCRDAIAMAEGRAIARCTTADDLARIAARAERRLTVLPKRLWVGAVVTHAEAGPWARSYNNGRGADATQVTLVRRSRDWALTAVARVRRYDDRVQLTVQLPATVTAGELAEFLLEASGLALAPEARLAEV